GAKVHFGSDLGSRHDRSRSDTAQVEARRPRSAELEHLSVVGAITSTFSAISRVGNFQENIDHEFIAGNQVEHLAVVPDDDRRATPVDILWTDIRSEFVDARGMTRHPRLDRLSAIGHVERPAPRLLDAFSGLTERERFVIRLERAIADGKLALL